MLHTCTSSVFIITNLYAEKFGHKGLTPGEMQDLRSCTFHGGWPIFLTLFYPVKVSLFFVHKNYLHLTKFLVVLKNAKCGSNKF